jgi:hypothetical protein
MVKMNTIRPLLTLILGLTAAAGLSARTDSQAESRVEVKYFEPENFADVRDDSMSMEPDRGTLAELGSYLEHRAGAALPPGHKLTVTFTDIDLAGDFEPWRGFRWSDIRIVKPLYPARLKFNFAVTDANGAIVQSGQRELSDLTLLRLGLSSDVLRFEKGLLDDWLRAEFPRTRS